jgi:hypothetical protein
MMAEGRTHKYTRMHANGDDMGGRGIWRSCAWDEGVSLLPAHHLRTWAMPKRTRFVLTTKTVLLMPDGAPPAAATATSPPCICVVALKGPSVNVCGAAWCQSKQSVM